MPRHRVLQRANCAPREQGLLRDDAENQPGFISCAFAEYKCVNSVTHSFSSKEAGPANMGRI